MHSYWAYGLGILSELNIPELIVKSSRLDVEIRRGNLNGLMKSIETDNVRFWTTDSDAYYNYKNICSFLLRDKKEIIIDLAPSVDERLVRLFLLGRVFGTLLHQRGKLVLHGSAISMNRGAVAFIGKSGSGKSTVAAYLCAKGYSLVADDLVVIDSAGAAPVVYPAFPQLNIWPDVAKSLGYDANELPFVGPNENKRAVHLGSNFSLSPIPLRRIYVLDRAKHVKAHILDHQESMIELVRNSYATLSLKAGNNLSSHFFHSANVAKNVSIYRWARPFGLEFMPDIVRTVEEDM